MADLQGAKPWPGAASWIPRLQEPLLRRRLEQFPAVALLGPRQVGKTTLALQLAATIPSLYLDLEASADLARLSEPSLFLQRHADKLVILDEVQRLPGLFAELRGLIDAGRRQGKANGRFLLLGSASLQPQPRRNKGDHQARANLQHERMVGVRPHHPRGIQWPTGWRWWG